MVGIQSVLPMTKAGEDGSHGAIVETFTAVGDHAGVGQTLGQILDRLGLASTCLRARQGDGKDN